MHWTGKNVLICGGSSGLGRQLAERVWEQQPRCLVLLARGSAGLQQVQDSLLADLAELGSTTSGAVSIEPRIIVKQVDLLDRSAMQQVTEQLRREVDELDLVIQAVGLSDRGRLLELDPEHLQDVWRVNVMTSLHALQTLAPMLRLPGGSFVLIGSLASRFAPRYMGGYAIAKHGVAALAQQARLELASQGLRVTLACPGPIARQDAGGRYDQLLDGTDLPPEVRQPGGGAKLNGLDPRRLADDILQAAAEGKPELIRPRKARLLQLIASIFPGLGDRLLRKRSG